MENVNEFLTKIKANAEAEKLQKAAYNTNEESVSHLLNHRSQSYAQGKLEEYRVLLNTCKFKLVIYWKFDKWNRPYTVNEKKAGQSKRPIPSIDKVGTKYDEELGLNTLIDKCLKEFSRMDAAQIYLIDRVNGYEHMIFKFNVQNIGRSEFTELEFMTSEKTGARYFNKMLDKPLRTDKIKVKLWENYQGKKALNEF